MLLAAGARPNIPPVEGVAQQGVFALRTLDDALRIKSYARPGCKTVVIGGGLLGLESARALKGMGVEVSVLQNGGRCYQPSWMRQEPSCCGVRSKRKGYQSC